MHKEVQFAAAHALAVHQLVGLTDVRIQARDFFINGGAVGKDRHLLDEALLIDFGHAAFLDALQKTHAVILRHTGRALCNLLTQIFQG